MSHSNCMYGEPHSGACIAVRSKVGRTIGWLCAHHFKQHEKTLLSNGYHFRTIEELQARGELDGSATEIGTDAKSLVLQPEPEQQQSGDDDSRWYSQSAQLAHQRALDSDTGRRPHGGETGRPVAGSGDASSRGQIPAAQKELEKTADGGGNQERGVQSRTSRPAEPQSLEWPAWTEGAGFLMLTEEQAEILQAPFPDRDITIRYDGVVYVPWRKYWARIVKAFAPYVPSIIPVGDPKVLGQEIVVGVVMTVNGRFIGKAWGSHRLEGQNDRMAYGDRIESAISDAISKIGKRLNMAEELWDDSFRDYWKSQYAEAYTNRGRTSWRRKLTMPIEEHDNELPDFTN